MGNSNKYQVIANGFAERINYELKRAERYRIFLSLVIFNFTPVIEIARNGKPKNEFFDSINGILKKSIREIDTISNSGREKIGLLFPETSRQGAEAATKRITDLINRYCTEYLEPGAEYIIPVEISSYPDAAGARSIASFLEEFVD